MGVIRNWILEMAHSRSLLDVQLEMLNRQLEFRGVKQVGESHVGFLGYMLLKMPDSRKIPGVESGWGREEV